MRISYLTLCLIFSPFAHFCRAAPPGQFHRFAQLGDGGGIRSVLLVVNQNPEPTMTRIRLYADDGQPLQLELDGTTATEFELEIPGRATRRLATAGTSDSAVVGWLELIASRPVGAQLLFEIRSGENLITQAAVESSGTLGAADVFVQQTAGSRTGLALANVSGGEIRIRLTLIDPEGTPGAFSDVTLPPRGHVARFLDQFFEGLGVFEGRISLNASGPIAITALQQTGLVLGTLTPVERLAIPNSDVF